jgi:3-deoxy-D-manno-octulosonic-acid transferase
LLILYRIFVWLYPLVARVLAWKQVKARRWVDGRKQVWTGLASLEQQRHPGQPLVWMHCSSLGEFEQGRPVLEAIRLQYPGHLILLSFFSPSGYETSKNYAGADHICYLPMDQPGHARKFLDLVKPDLVLFVKYEFWHYYLQAIRQRHIPLVLVSGIFRNSQPFFRWYGRFHRNMLACFSQIFVQNEDSRQLLAGIGFNAITHISGDTRFDRVRTIAAAARTFPQIDAFCNGHQVIVAGSTWTEDDEVLDHFANTRLSLRFIIAPHDIEQERLDECLHLYHQSILYSRYCELAAAGQPTDVYRVLIIDNVGMLSSLYRYASIALVGGGFGDEGVHNTLEAAVYGIPVLMGPVYDKYAEAVALVDCGGAIPVIDALELETELDALLGDADYYRDAAKAAGNYVASAAGATAKIMDYIQAKRLLTN